MYLMCAEKMGIRPEKCVVYEDIIKGIKSAKSVGMRVTAVYDEGSRNKWHETKKAADHFLLSFGDNLN